MLNYFNQPEGDRKKFVSRTQLPVAAENTLPPQNMVSLTPQPAQNTNFTDLASLASGQPTGQVPAGPPVGFGGSGRGAATGAGFSSPGTQSVSALPQKQTSLQDYWKKPVIGNMPRDQFVSIAGMLANAIAPDTAQGRAGGALGVIGQRAYNERSGREREDEIYARGEADRKLNRDYKTAQIKNLGKEAKAKTPSAWDAFYTSKVNQINPVTEQIYNAEDIVKEFKEANTISKDKEAKYGWIGKKNGSKVWGELKPGVVSEIAPDKSKSGGMTRPQAAKEITSIEGKIYSVKTKGGLMEMIVNNPEFAASFAEQFGNPESQEAQERYLEHLESRLDELYPMVGKAREKKEAKTWRDYQ